MDSPRARLCVRLGRLPRRHALRRPAAPASEGVVWADPRAIEDEGTLALGVVRKEHEYHKRGYFTVPLYLDPPRADFIETVKRARQVWLDENPGEDGTDQVTPFDRFLYGA